MVRFKVVKGSHILLFLSILILLAVVTVILLQSAPQQYMQTSSIAKIESVTTPSEAKAISAFASSDLEIQIVPDIPKATMSAPSILIYHTHTHEAFSQDPVNPYAATEVWRTIDPDHNVVRLGKALFKELSALGYHVTHDTTDHEQDDMDTSYIRSLKTLEGYTEEFDLTIDLHRDAYVDGLLPFLEHEGTHYAQLMMLVGRGDSYADKEKPNYTCNLAVAQKITRTMNEQIPGICRNVTVKEGRYNQHVGKAAVLIELGHNQNSLEQALNSVPILANAIDKYFH